MIVPFIFIVLTSLISAVDENGTQSASPESVSIHKFHVSYARMAIEGNVVVARVRFFKDDLSEALAAFSPTELEDMVVSPAQDSLFQSYFDKHFFIETDDNRLQGKLIGSGEELLDEEPMWWVMMEFESEHPLTSIRITNSLLMDQFEDQKNIVQLQHFPSEKNWSLYFVEDARLFNINLQE